jgi:tRNA dimethylallyltransferase
VESSINNHFVAVCGPTASGKSSLSVALAKYFNAEVLSFDASQTFLGANIGTAKITDEEKSNIPHHLLDLVSPDQKLEAGFFVNCAKEKFKEVSDRCKIPLLCIGTSMYLTLFLEGMAQTGSGDLALRQSLETKDNDSLYEMLSEIDPARAAVLHRNDRLRVIRALEICSITGKPASLLYAQQSRKLCYSGLFLVLCWNRDDLSVRIEQRVNQMLEQGLVEECRLLLKTFGPNAQIFDSIGYAETLRYLKAEITEGQLKELISLHTKQLAKKQMTFLRRFPTKYGFSCIPKQNFEANLIESKSRKKALRLDFIGAKCSISELGQECREYLQNSVDNSQSRVLYVDASWLFQSSCS